MHFDIIDKITEIETIAKGTGIRELNRLRKFYGLGNWKKMKGIARIRLSSSQVGCIPCTTNTELIIYSSLNLFGA